MLTPENSGSRQTHVNNGEKDLKHFYKEMAFELLLEE